MIARVVLVMWVAGATARADVTPPAAPNSLPPRECVAALERARVALPELRAATVTQLLTPWHLGPRHAGGIGWWTHTNDLTLKLDTPALLVVAQVRSPFQPWPPDAEHTPDAAWQREATPTSAGFPDGVPATLCERRPERDAHATLCIARVPPARATLLAATLRPILDRCLATTRW